MQLGDGIHGRSLRRSVTYPGMHTLARHHPKAPGRLRPLRGQHRRAALPRALEQRAASTPLFKCRQQPPTAVRGLRVMRGDRDGDAPSPLSEADHRLNEVPGWRAHESPGRSLPPRYPTRPREVEALASSLLGAQVLQSRPPQHAFEAPLRSPGRRGTCLHSRPIRLVPQSHHRQRQPRRRQSLSFVLSAMTFH